MGAQAEGDAALNHIRAQLGHLALLVDEHYVDAELHEEAVDAFAGYDPKAFAFSEGRVLQQAAIAGSAGVGDVGAVGQDRFLGEIADAELQAAHYNRCMEKATFGAGCFWGVEAAFRRLAGVESTRAGYLGGKLDRPTYEDVCTDRTGHAEVVEVTFNPEVISFCDLLEVFWNNHNPTTMNRQGTAVGSQYRSAIFFHSPEQEAEAKT